MRRNYPKGTKRPQEIDETNAGYWTNMAKQLQREWYRQKGEPPKPDNSFRGSRVDLD